MCRDHHLLAGLELHRTTTNERANADLRSLQVLHHRDRTADHARRVSNRLAAPRVVGLSPVREVEPRNIEPRAHQL